MNYPPEFKDFARFKELEVSLWQSLYQKGKINQEELKEYISIAKRRKYSPNKNILKAYK